MARACVIPDTVQRKKRNVYRAGEGLGFAARDTASIRAVLERMNGFERHGGERVHNQSSQLQRKNPCLPIGARAFT